MEWWERKHVASFQICSPFDTHIQDVSKIEDMTSGMTPLYVDNKNSLYQHKYGNA
jgi:hypothetical protein